MSQKYLKGYTLDWHLKNVIIGSMRNWSRIALEWNLANDPQYGPHTPGGCSQCRGALTIDGNEVNRNVSYYIIGQIAKFAAPGSVRISCTAPGILQNVAFKRTDGKTVLLVVNESQSLQSFNIYDGQNWIAASLPEFTAGTFVW